MKRAEVFGQIRKFIMPPQFDDPEKNRRAQLVNILAWIGIVFLLYLIVSYIIEGYSLFDPSSLMLEALFILILIIIWLIHRGYVQGAGILLVLSSWSTMAYEAWIGSGVRDTAIAGELVIVLGCSLLLGWQATVGLSILSIASLWTMTILEAHGVRHAAIDDIYSVSSDMTAAFGLSAVLAYLLMNNLQNYMKALHVSEERFRKFFHANPLPIAIFTLEESRFMEANDAFLDFKRIECRSSNWPHAARIQSMEG